MLFIAHSWFWGQGVNWLKVSQVEVVGRILATKIQKIVQPIVQLLYSLKRNLHIYLLTFIVIWFQLKNHAIHPKSDTALKGFKYLKLNTTKMQQGKISDTNRCNFHSVKSYLLKSKSLIHRFMRFSFLWFGWVLILVLPHFIVLKTNNIL